MAEWGDQMVFSVAAKAVSNDCTGAPLGALVGLSGACSSDTSTTVL
jgi:hypothetical protein